MISKQIATDIAVAHHEIEAAELLLADIERVMERSEITRKDIRDVFGRRQNGLQLGVPSGESSHRLFDVPWKMAKPIISAHIANQRTLVELLSAQALIEAATLSPTAPDGDE